MKAAENPLIRDVKAARRHGTAGKVAKSNWIVHIFDCNPKREITTADYLALAVRKNPTPDNSQTCKDYGFTREFDNDKRCKLLGLYIGLMERLEVKPRTVHKWRTSGKLVEKIQAAFETLPPGSRGGYYPWFMENLWVLDGFEGVSSDAEKGVEDMIQGGWIYAGGSPSASAVSIKDALSKMPEERATCVLSCSLILSDLHPNPSQDIWISFGFCTCDKESELGLGDLYRRLLHSCSFQEFSTAYTSSRLGTLFKSKGLGAVLSGFDFLEDVLALSPRQNFSVWDLKQLIVADEVEGEQARIIPSVTVDYGFMNCKSQDEVLNLKGVYTAYFRRIDANPPDLHQACIKRKLYEYISGLVKLQDKKKFRRLMKNPYPLSELDCLNRDT